MLRSLVGSEMCIRDSTSPKNPATSPKPGVKPVGPGVGAAAGEPPVGVDPNPDPAGVNDAQFRFLARLAVNYCHSGRDPLGTRKASGPSRSQPNPASQEDSVCTAKAQPKKRARIAPEPPAGARKAWTEAEIEELVQGIERCGEGKWALILETGAFPSHRTQVHLKDKYRNLKKSGRIR
eukprot:TRINITY_DN39759_c0_g1_i1.p1 TRINITY_DN39759_c0_g1~~TRINITY_DN39759_c0_g1_i1.p1  ORF type:complete len:196 (+),score=52.93 TRINITY_DN39759_c0_g1_i1:53-589(+)